MIEEDGCIYHYTDKNGITGILENNCLWARHYNYTNDETELLVFPYILKKWISNNSPFELTDITYILLDAFNTMVQGPLSKSHPYISSFCNDYGDTLSQWRGYGNDDGFSIGFNYRVLEEYKNFINDKYSIDFINISEVFYDYNDYKVKIENDISKFLELFKKYCNDKFINHQPHAPLTEYQREILSES